MRLPIEVIDEIKFIHKKYPNQKHGSLDWLKIINKELVESFDCEYFGDKIGMKANIVSVIAVGLLALENT